MDLRFVNHPGFHRASFAMVALAAGFSVIALPLATRLHVAPTLIGGALAISVAAGWAYGAGRQRALLGLLACAPVAMSSTWGALLAMAGLTAAAVALAAPSRRRALATVAIGTLAVTLAGWAGLKILYAQETSGWTPVLRALFGGAAMGMIGVLSTLPRHVTWQFDAVLGAARKLPTSLEVEVRQLCDRSLSMWAQAKQRWSADPASLELLRSGVLKVLEVAQRTAQRLEAVPNGSEADLVDRIADLDRRIAVVSDAETRSQYLAARDGLEDQRKYRDRLRASRERMVARLHNHVAALEKFHLAAVSLDVSKTLSGDEPLAKQLAELSSEVSASGDALAEITEPASSL